MIYTVNRIDEDLDFGCEERSADSLVMAIVTLIAPSGEELYIKAEDDMLYKRGINEGDQVYFDENNQLEKVLDRDWTKRCNTKTVDTTTFVNMMQAVKAGKTVNWKCPFCGGNVILMKSEGGHTMIGCDECDMRINLETN